MDNSSPEISLKTLSNKYNRRVSKTALKKNFETGIFLSTQESKEFKDNLIETPKSNISDFNYISKDLLNKIEESSPFKSIRSSNKDLNLLCHADEENEEKSELYPSYRKNSDSSFEAKARAKTNKFSNISQMQIKEEDEIVYDLHRNKIREQVHTVFPDDFKSDDKKERSESDTILFSLMNMNLNRKKENKGIKEINESNVNFPSQAQSFNNGGTNNVINFNPTFSNSFNYYFNPYANNMYNDSRFNDYFMYLRQLQMQSHLSSNTSNRGNLSNEVNNNVTEFTKTFMYGKQGWICHSCKNFNYESRVKCNRCQKIPSREVKSNQIQNVKISNESFEDSKKIKLTEREGDWSCLKCKNLNFAFRMKCNRCQISKSENNNLIEESTELNVKNNSSV